jgi:hypothetical protein
VDVDDTSSRSLRQALLDSETLARPLTYGAEAFALRELAAAVARDIDRDRGALGRLHALRTPARVAMVAGLGLLPATFYLAMHMPTEGGLLASAGWKLAPTLASIITLVAACVLLLAPLSRPRSDGLRWTTALLGLAIPAAVALVTSSTVFASSAHTGITHSGVSSASAVACFGMGVLCSAPSFALSHALARSRLRGGIELGLIGALTGISASMALDLHCVSEHLEHLLLGHASIGLAWAGFAWVGSVSPRWAA